LGDSWFASNENIDYLEHLNQKFIFRIKDNRLVALNYEDKIKGKFSKIKEIDKKHNGCLVYLKGSETPIKLAKLYVKNGKNSIIRSAYFITNDTNINLNSLSEIYQKRWRVEEFHKTIKQNLNIEKSPTKVLITQVNHILLTFFSFLKIEKIRLKSKTSIFYLKQQLQIEALKSAYNKLTDMKVSYG
jgi:IS4 transposase